MIKSSNKLQSFSLAAIALGVWVLVLQNLGSKEIHGSVDVDNIVSIDIKKINGQTEVFYQDSDGKFMVLPVTIR